jgi:hypothetical protein
MALRTARVSFFEEVLDLAVKSGRVQRDIHRKVRFSVMCDDGHPQMFSPPLSGHLLHGDLAAVERVLGSIVLFNHESLEVAKVIKHQPLDFSGDGSPAVVAEMVRGAVPIPRRRRPDRVGITTERGDAVTEYSDVTSKWQVPPAFLGGALENPPTDG